LRFLGRISYPLYLIHGAAGSELVARLLTAGWNPNVAVLVTIASAIGLAWAISTFVEWPAQRWLRTRFAAWANRARRSLNEVLSPGGPHCHCERSEAIPRKERNAKGIAAALRSPQ
jgi:peptidoglycan/LPS O-acetylase OafA/YrhL